MEGEDDPERGWCCLPSDAEVLESHGTPAKKSASNQQHPANSTPLLGQREERGGEALPLPFLEGRQGLDLYIAYWYCCCGDARSTLLREQQNDYPSFVLGLGSSSASSSSAPSSSDGPLQQDRFVALLLNGIRKATTTAAAFAAQLHDSTEQELTPGHGSISRHIPLADMNEDRSGLALLALMQCDFVDYASLVFHRLRLLYGFSADTFLDSFDTETNQLESMSSPGKSGCSFYFSVDRRFVLKTIHKEEFKFFKTNIYSYYEHMKQNPNSLLVRIFGLYTLKQGTIKNLLQRESRHVVIMENLVPVDRSISECYDLKGSTHGRVTLKPTERKGRDRRGSSVDKREGEDVHSSGGGSEGVGEGRSKLVILKDLDFHDRRTILLVASRRQLFLEQLEADATWLYSRGCMDYSLFLLVSKTKPPTDHHTTSSHSQQTSGKRMSKRRWREAITVHNRSHLTNPFRSQHSEEEGEEPEEESQNEGGKRRHHLFKRRQRRNQHQQQSNSKRSHDDGEDDNEEEEEEEDRPSTKMSVFRLDEGGFAASNELLSSIREGEIYYMGIIDILQPYNWRKQLENAYRKLFVEEEAISCVDPYKYS
ncbi:Phosphatidylinositol-4-phosphate 5-kinase, variant 2 [Balamuthia mandrillaris]